MKLNGTHQFLVYADDVNILGGSVHTVNKNKKALVIASRETGLEVNADKTKYMVMSRDQNAGRNHNMKIDNRSFERVEELQYLGTTITNENLIQEEIKSRLRSGNVCYRWMQDLLSSSLLSKNSKFKIYRTIILPDVCYGCETWSLTLKNERRLRVFENRMLRRLFGSKSDEVTEVWRKLHNDELYDLYFPPNIGDQTKK